jgi:uncharacterized paraquat-inducible protein A
MSKTCDGCKNKAYTEEEKMLTVPYVVHQSAAARQERQIRRMWIALIVSIALMFFTNMIWVGVFSSYDYSSEEIIVDAEDNGNANYIGQDGNIYNGENNSAETQED